MSNEYANYIEYQLNRIDWAISAYSDRFDLVDRSNE